MVNKFFLKFGEVFPRKVNGNGEKKVEILIRHKVDTFEDIIYGSYEKNLLQSVLKFSYSLTLTADSV